MDKTERISITWMNPTDAESGLLIRRRVGAHVYQREVPGNGLLTANEAAHAIGCTRVNVYKRIRAGTIKAVRKEGRLMVPISEVKRITGIGDPLRARPMRLLVTRRGKGVRRRASRSAGRHAQGSGNDDG